MNSAGRLFISPISTLSLHNCNFNDKRFSLSVLSLILLLPSISVGAVVLYLGAGRNSASTISLKPSMHQVRQSLSRVLAASIVILAFYEKKIETKSINKKHSRNADRFTFVTFVILNLFRQGQNVCNVSILVKRTTFQVWILHLEKNSYKVMITSSPMNSLSNTNTTFFFYIDIRGVVGAVNYDA